MSHVPESVRSVTSSGENRPSPVLLLTEQLVEQIAAREDALVEAIAERVADVLVERRPLPRFLDAKQLAQVLGVTPAWVTENAAALGGIPLSDGERPRWRFDLAEVVEIRRACLASRRPAEANADSAGVPTRRRRTTDQSKPRLLTARPPKRRRPAPREPR